MRVAVIHWIDSAIFYGPFDPSELDGPAKMVSANGERNDSRRMDCKS